MEIQDNDPERRNLLVTSMGFIAFFYAGGEFQEETIRLQVINIHFSEPFVLAFLAWLLLFWFLYRYWLTHRNSFRDGFSKEISKYYLSLKHIKFAENKIGSPILPKDKINKEDEGYFVSHYIEKKGMPGLKIDYGNNIQYNDKEGSLETYTIVSEKSERIYFDGFKGFTLIIRAILKCCADSPSFSNYLVPYIVFTIAMLGPLFKFILN